MAGVEEELALPALLRAARLPYTQAVRATLAEQGFDDLPRNGPFVLAGMANRRGSAGELVRVLRVSKQAASQLVDALVVRGYLNRSADPDDRRRSTLTLTGRGHAAAEAVRAGIEDVDAELAARLRPAELATLRKALGILTELAAAAD